MHVGEALSLCKATLFVWVSSREDLDANAVVTLRAQPGGVISVAPGRVPPNSHSLHLEPDLLHLESYPLHLESNPLHLEKTPGSILLHLGEDSCFCGLFPFLSVNHPLPCTRNPKHCTRKTKHRRRDVSAVVTLRAQPGGVISVAPGRVPPNPTLTPCRGTSPIRNTPYP